MIGFIDVATAELAKLVDYVITYPANEQLKFYMVADRFMYNAGEFPEYEDLYKELDQYLFVRNICPAAEYLLAGCISLFSFATSSMIS